MEWLKQTPMGAALLELAEEMEKQDMPPPVTLQVIGGFTLMLRGVRPLTGVTDIDFRLFKLRSWRGMRPFFPI